MLARTYCSPYLPRSHTEALAPPAAHPLAYLWQLALPYSFRESSTDTDFRSLGIGIQLYFSQLRSLAFIFFLMGFISLSALLTNIEAWHRTLKANDAADGSLISMLLVGSALGARSEPFDAQQSGSAELTQTFLIVLYLTYRRRQIQLLTADAAPPLIT